MHEPLMAFGFRLMLAMSIAVCGSARGEPAVATDADSDPVLAAQTSRVEMIDRVSRSVVCIFDSHHQGVGAGVLIDADGYGLTNYHVVAGMLPTDHPRHRPE